MIARSFIREVGSWMGATACSSHRRHAAILAAAFAAFAGSGAAFGQSCGPGTPGALDCGPVEHAISVAASCSPRCVGEFLNCTGSVISADPFLDPFLVKGAFNTVRGVVRDPAVGDLEINAVTGNAICTGGAACTGVLPNAGCTFPCLIGPTGKTCGDAGSGLTLPGAPASGAIQVVDRNLYTILVTDAPTLSNVFNFTIRDLCDSGCTSCAANDDSALKGSSTPIPTCGDSDPCNIDCCELGVCSHPSTCVGATCRDVNGNVTVFPPLVCNDNSVCTGPDTCNAALPNSTPQQCCEYPPHECPLPPVCFTQGPCDPVTDCPPPVSDCVSNPTLCDDGDVCTRDICDESAPGCCRYENICTCGDGIVGNTPGETCDPPGSDPAPVGDGNLCRANCTYCGDENVDAGEACDGADDAACPGLCDANCTCIPVTEGICRTPGFWCTHANDRKRNSQNITQAVIDACGGVLDVCGECISTTVPVDDASSAIEALGVSPKGQIVLQNARQLTALALNCCISGFGADCGDDATLNGLLTDCNNACQGLPSSRSNARCRDEIDCYNNGGQFDPVTGTCGDGGADNCHTRQLVNEDLGLNFQPPGPAGSSEDCHAAHGNHCAILDLADCSARNKQGEDCCDTDSCPELPVDPNPECEGATCGNFIPCNPTSGCIDPVCATTQFGGVCLEGATGCGGLPTCTTNSDCAVPGAVCAVDTCCVVGVCIEPSLFCADAPVDECFKEAACAAAQVCTDGACACFFTAAGNTRCFAGEFSCGSNPACVTDADCAAGFACSNTCCGLECTPLCGPAAAAAPARDYSAGSISGTIPTAPAALPVNPNTGGRSSGE